ncbi:MAG: hypothetical protein JNM17_17615 [Archangium sp.]|nr:hypothetical protein [Archangium sp.]
MNAAPKTNPIVVAFDHPGGSLTKCFWSYRVLVHQDGTVDFTGRGVMRREGDFHWSMPRERVDLILKKFDPLWDAPLEETERVVDAGENCLYVANGGRRFLKCFIGWRGGTEPFYAFAHYVTFKTNAVQWMGEHGERDPDCRPRDE